MILIIDNYDSFVYNLAQYIAPFDNDIHIFRNDRITIPEIEKLNPDAIIISPGPKRPEDARISVDIVKHFYDKKPILGICLGHQVLGYVFHANIVHAGHLVHGKRSRIKHTGDILFKHVPEVFEAGRYHSLAVSADDFPHNRLEVIASTTDDNEIMGIKVKDYPVYGLQFHPESILADQGKLIISNFYNFIVAKAPKTKAIQLAIKKLSLKEDLNEEEAGDVMEEIMTGKTSDIRITAYLMGLKLKTESINEIVGSIRVIKKLMNSIDLDIPGAVDTCGTGGDNYNTFNISTAASLVVAGCGIPVAKHGNRSISSKSGSADLFASLGVKTDASKEKIVRSVKEAHIGFIFAPLFHPAFKNVAVVRKEMGVRTIFNMIGPVVNPANVTRQIFGIFSPELTEKFCQVLQNTGSQKALVYSSAESMDEISPFSLTKISYLNKGTVKTFFFDPERYGAKTGKIEDIQVNNIEESKKMILEILENKSRNTTALNAVLLNAAAGIFVSSDHDDFEKEFPGCLEKARHSVESGNALNSLKKMIQITNE
ncbi:MAG: anthranilate phosphoribosyltransferase [bacterium]|nr:anthranilate phosphoribosyltransferase [bacterium]